MRTRTLGGLSLCFALFDCATAPPAKATSRYQVTADGVLDTSTGLTWERATPFGSAPLAAAQGYCAGLPGGSWRVPTRAELLSILDTSRPPSFTSASIDNSAFTGTPATLFWSSSIDEKDSDRAWCVDFWNGKSNPNGVSNTYKVRCVR